MEERGRTGRGRSRRALVAAALLLAGIVAASPADSALAEPTLTLVVEGGGELYVPALDLTCRARCQEPVETGVELTIVASPDAGQVRTGWSGACAGTQGDVCTVVAARVTIVRVGFAAAASRPQPPPEPPPETIALPPARHETIGDEPTPTAPPPPLQPPPSSPRGGPSSPSELENSVDDALDDAIASLPKGALVFNKPTRTGDLTLRLTLTGFVVVEGERKPHRFKPFDRTLTVQVTFGSRMRRFAGAHWLDVLLALLGSGAVAGLLELAFTGRRPKRA